MQRTGSTAADSAVLGWQRMVGNRATTGLLAADAAIVRRTAGSGREASAAGANDSTLPPALQSYLARSMRRGLPLSARVRERLEPTFGAGLDSVRVHADAEAARAAASINARAFALGHDIWFGPGEYRPQHPAGSRLLAHEVAHTREQRPVTTAENARLGAPTDRAELRAARAAAAVSTRSPAPGGVQQPATVIRRATYETRGTQFDPATMQQLIDQGYWLARTIETFDLTVDPRMSSDREESDAVLAAVWGLPPPTRITATITRLVPIAARVPTSGSTTAPPALLYEVTFSPPATRGGKPRLELRFAASGAGTTPVAAPAAPAAYQPTQPGLSFSGFPAAAGNELDAYFAAHPDEHRALFQWLENTAPATFDQVVTTETTTTNTRGTTRVTHRSVFHVRGTRTGTGASASFGGLRIDLISEGTVDAVQTVPTTYQDRDAGDWRIEQQQARTPATSRMGAVTGLAAVPAAELPAVKIALAQYFSRTPFAARDTEVDARVPIGNSGGEVLYTFTYGAANAVSVERIGAVGTGTGQIDLGRIDVTRVRGFPGSTATPAALRAWWSARYPQGGTLPPGTPVTGQTPAQQRHEVLHLMAAMNMAIAAGIANRSWFNDNWGIEVLDAAGTATRLQTTHSVPTAMTSDTTDFDATDLRMLELALETLTDSELTRLRGIKVGRKTASLQRNAAGYAAGSAGQYGFTLMDQPSGGNPQITVLYFGVLYQNDTSLFTGSTAANAGPAAVFNVLHELGHATGYQAGIEAAFNAWRAATTQTSPTWYAASNAAHEFFPEAYALYHMDPRWLCSHAPLVHAWFEELERTGTPPGASAQLTAPTSCP